MRWLKKVVVKRSGRKSRERVKRERLCEMDKRYDTRREKWKREREGGRCYCN